ncbi:MAG TPA: hypothetical protein VF081_13690 [Solirubrobacterales bacterium]
MLVTIFAIAIPQAQALIVESTSAAPEGYGPKQLRDAYDIPDWAGSEQTIAIIATADAPNAEADLAVYRSYYDLPPCTEANGCFRKRDHLGGTSNFPQPQKASAEETSLDLQMASAACPRCNLLLVERQQVSSGFMKATGEAINRAVALGATVISYSYGRLEESGDSSLNNYFNHPGVPITVSSGDDGYRGHLDGKNATDYPAGAPGVVAVGGTYLKPAPNTPRGWRDYVWEETGGGCSAEMPRPEWQDFISCGTRMTSDIALVASNVAIYSSYLEDDEEKRWLKVGGTSVGAPLMAGIYAHSNEIVHKKPAEAIYSNLYDGFGSIYDVGPSTTDNNTNYQGHSCSPLYLCNAVAGKDGDAMSGYDGPTGVGVPQGVPALPLWVLAHSKNVDFHFFVDGMPDIDCASPTMCIAVGGSEESNGAWPMAAEWDGYQWNTVSVPSENKYLEDLGKLRGVSCPTTDFCLAVGEMDGSGYQETYVLQWNGGQWQLDESAPSLTPQSVFTAPFSVSCASATDCMIVGGEVQRFHGNMRMESLHLTSSGWSTPEVPSPSGVEGAGLSKVSCAAEEVEGEEEEICLAVGWLYSETAESFQVFAERWDGYEWSVDTSLTPPGVQSELWDVSCPSVNSCMGIGWMAESPENYKYEDSVPISEHWNGSEWVLGKPPLPEPEGDTAEEEGEEEEGEAYGVSCGTPTSCIAVGINFGTGYIIAGWNGTSWSEQEPPEMSLGAFDLPEQVDCVTATYCQVMGIGGGSTFFNILTDDPPPPVLEGTVGFGAGEYEALTLGMVNPNGSPTTYQYEYGTTTSYGSKSPATPKSIGSGTSSVEVSEKIEGLAPETTYHFRLVATNAKGTVESEDQTFMTPGWKILSTPNPSGASDSNLHDVSCEPNTSVCTAVGKSTKSGADSPVAQRWNGTSWSEQSPAKKSGTLPTRLFGVDCPSETRCLAAGNYQPSEGGPTLLTEIWNESKWSVQSPPVPSEATSSELVGIGCSSTSRCGAVGSAMIGGVKTAIAEKWTSPNWALESIPIPEGATSSQLDGIDCIWSDFCAAVGRYTTSGGAVKSLVMFWNGEWKLHSLTAPEGAVETTLLDVSCTKTPNRCTAVGGWKNSKGEQSTLAYRFNGVTTWTLQSTPNPSGSTESVFQDVSCATEASCTAAGSSVDGGTTKTLAEKWNGTSWSIQGTPNPSGAAFSSLFGVSCQSTTCMGAGWSTDASGVDTTLGEIRE